MNVINRQPIAAAAAITFCLLSHLVRQTIHPSVLTILTNAIYIFIFWIQEKIFIFLLMKFNHFIQMINFDFPEKSVYLNHNFIEK